MKESAGRVFSELSPLWAVAPEKEITAPIKEITISNIAENSFTAAKLLNPKEKRNNTGRNKCPWDTLEHKKRRTVFV